MGKKGQKQGKGNGGQARKPHVAEATKIQIAKLLEEFRLSNSEVYTFEADLTNTERAEVHMLCRKMGMVSKSSGRGQHRRVSVFKALQKKAEKNDTGSIALTFSDDTQSVLRDLFAHYPPGDDESFEEIKSFCSKNERRQRNYDTSFCKPIMSKRDIKRKLDLFASRIKESPQLRKISEDRSKLPIASFIDAITDSVESHQVPQYLLDHMWRKSQNCKIVCTQPRRISAISVAERIAWERGEGVGESVGYKIRLESEGGKHSSIMFCTNGILLRLLIGMGAGTSKKEAKLDEAEAHEITHIIVDEIHERDRFADFMLAILRDQLPLWPHLHLVLMSATIDAERFSQYFGGCPIIRVPGFTYPVKTYHLEDVLSILRSPDAVHANADGLCNETSLNQLTEEYRIAMDESISLAWVNDEFEPLLELISTEVSPEIHNYQHSSTGATPLMVLAGKGRVGDVCMLLSFGADCFVCDNDGRAALDWAESGNHLEVVGVLKSHMEQHDLESEEEKQLLEKYLSTVNQDHVDIVLIEKLLKKICIDSVEGAILVFFPGWEDISQSRERLLSSPFFRDSSKFQIIVLHSMIPSMEQKKVFKHPPPGVRKIILSTNIAETAVTIDDVVYVIDSGRMKEKSYDPYNNVSTLQSSWISKASAKQREGRAGRCQPGICYHLYSKARAASLPHYDVPEIKRTPIEELCLQVKLLDPQFKIVDFIQRTLDPPVFEAIHNAVVVLQEIGALTEDEHLTELGKKIGSLPVHPLTSKMLLFAILMNCLDPALTLACTSGYRDPFVLPILPDEKKRAKAAKLELASLYGGHSDQLALIAAFDCWKGAKAKGQEQKFCSQYFISPSVMNMLFGLRKQLQIELIQNGFIPEDVSNCSLNSKDPGILRAIILAGMYPMVGRLLPRLKNGQKAVVETASGAKVRLHPHSSNFSLSSSKCLTCPLLAYDEVTRGDGGIYIKNCTLVGPYPLLLLATEMVVAPANENEDEYDEESDTCMSDEDEKEPPTASVKQETLMSSPENSVSVVIDRWLRFEATALDVAQIYCLRERLFAAILFKVHRPQEILPPALGASVYAIACMLAYDGMSGIDAGLMSVDSLTTMVKTTGIESSSSKKHFISEGKKSIRSHCPSNSLEYLKSLLNADTAVAVAACNSTQQLHKSKSTAKLYNGQRHNGSSHKHSKSAGPTNKVPSERTERASAEPPFVGGSNPPRAGSFKRQRENGFQLFS
ncbi:DExH-box ATP-dependent RNA helicase DExH6 isoform X2 [Nymphaea colorata]|uniref:DExH-box ATP-dependent RNA helicase DExH6 isoform X2 n=1 Tax=Nymphaea colorata TaxID=210225 RepID=UPI00129D488D|nr:DExH-box ATP-dependent RNA helicase DExH6 isoform X2 [Nymphaea colorata]